MGDVIWHQHVHRQRQKVVFEKKQENLLERIKAKKLRGFNAFKHGEAETSLELKIFHFYEDTNLEIRQD